MSHRSSEDEIESVSFQEMLHKNSLNQGERLCSIPKVMMKWMGGERGGEDLHRWQRVTR